MSENLRLYVRQKKENEYDMLTLRAGTAVLLFVGTLLAVNSMFHLEYHLMWAVCIGILIILAMTLFWKDKMVIYAIILVTAGFFVVGFLLRSRFAVNGLMVVLNQCIRAVGTQTPKIYRTFSAAVSDDNAMLFATFFMTMAAGVLAVFCAAAVNARSKSILFLMLAVFLLMSVRFQIIPGRKHCMLLFAAFLAAFFVIGAQAKKIRAYIYMAVAAALVLLVSIGGAALLSPAEGTSPMFAGLTEKLRYEKSPADNYPKGQLSELEKITKSDEAVLTVTMTQPYATYLRGYVGSVFDNRNWCELDYEVTFDNNSMFSWLHENGFYAWKQLSLLDSLRTDEQKLQHVTIDNRHADSRYLYLPYETAGIDETTLKPNNDETAYVDTWSGQRTYAFSVCDPVWRDTVSLGAGLYHAQTENQEESSLYLQSESHYNEFVYANYTSLTSQQRAVFDRLMPIAVNENEAHISYEDAKDYVSRFLAENLSYDETAHYAAADDDFLRSLLMEERTGCDVHYATAAALYYRYLGIPARYVEGYVITDEDAAAMTAGEPYTLKGTGAHAWVEIYMDTIGWVPVEVTPGFAEKMSAS